MFATRVTVTHSSLTGPSGGNLLYPVKELWYVIGNTHISMLFASIPRFSKATLKFLSAFLDALSQTTRASEMRCGLRRKCTLPPNKLKAEIYPFP